MLNLNLRGAVVGPFILMAMIGMGCAHTEPGPADSADVPEQPAEPRLSTREQEDLAIAEWEAWKATTSWEERLELMGLEEDPGPDPDPEREWIRFGRRYNIHRFAKRSAVFHDTPFGWVRPMRGVTVGAEIYRDDDESVWVWLEAPDEGEPVDAAHVAKYPIRDLIEEHRRAYMELRDEFVTLTPPQSDEVVRFVESSHGLPRSGSWRNSPAVVDINGDGHLDIVAPPQRGDFFGVGPSIFLGDGTGNWRKWEEVEWPASTLDYGAVRAADFNGNGHIDLAFGVHLLGVAVYLHDGNGRFTDSSEGLPETTFPTRRIEVADVDGDGFPDVIALTEGPDIDIREPRRRESKMRIFRNENRGTRWEEYEIGEPERAFGGDWLAVGDFNGDPYPDFVTASIYFHGSDVFWLSDGTMSWRPVGREFLPPFSYIGAVAAGNMTSSPRDDAVLSFTRFWPRGVNPDEVPHPSLSRIAGIELVSFSGPEPVRKSVIRWESDTPTWAMAVGDVNGNGHNDIVYIRTHPAENGVLLNDGAGNFRRAKIEGWEVVPNVAYDLTLADVDGDGRLDIIVMYERLSSERDGSIRVHLNRTGEQ
jgi:hypothetical protein